MYGTVPSACSYIRLIIPLMSKYIQKNFKLRVGNLTGIKNFRPDIIITSRLPCTNEVALEKFLTEVRRSNAKLIYDIDDNLLELHDTHPEKDFYESKKPLILQLLSNSNCVWTSTDNLAQYLQPYCQKITTIKNYLNKDLLVVKKQEVKTNEKFKILYMGTTSHKMDLEFVIKNFEALISKGLSFELYLLGINDKDYLQEWIKILKPPSYIDSYPNFMQWMKTLGPFDLGIAPLESSTFNECKSDIKFWDYTSIGIPILASKIGAYCLIIEHGKNGLLADNSKNDWIKNVSWAINNRGKLKNLITNATDALIKLSEERAKENLRLSSLYELINIEETR